MALQLIGPAAASPQRPNPRAGRLQGQQGRAHHARLRRHLAELRNFGTGGKFKQLQRGRRAHPRLLERHADPPAATTTAVPPE